MEQDNICNETANCNQSCETEQRSPIKKTYAYHSPSPDSLALITKIRTAASFLDDVITTCAPASRERSVAITKLEEAAMWAIKAVVCNDPSSKREV